MDVAGGGADAAMSLQDLDDAKVGTGFEEVGGKTVTQGMGSDPLAHAGGPAGTLADFLYARSGNGPIKARAGKEDIPGPHSFPIGAKDFQQAR